ncbi:MAG: CHASE2 domain-containing protein [Oscillatoria sp. SIO1A7]|nr:CHASE2 domain-containing protein [Oscillatoria sp. SIO1A7]
MSKLVTLNIVNGEFDKGFPVILEVEKDGQPILTQKGQLPPAPTIPELYENWRYAYRKQNKYDLRAGTTDTYRAIRPDTSLKANISVLDSAEMLQKAIDGWLDSGAKCFQPIRDLLLRQLDDGQEPPRFVIKTDNQLLWRIPWHLWSLLEEFPKTEIALSLTNIRNQSTANAEKGKQVKILAILGNSKGIDVEADRQELKQIPKAETTFLVKPERKEINDQLWDRDWDILFFAGHSSTENDTGRIFINDRDSLTLEQLRYGLEKAIKRGLKLAIFNSCDGLGLARNLAGLNLPYTIFMREPVPDRVAQEFAKHFLQNFSQGKPFYLAVKEARQRLQGLEERFPCASWLPVVCQNPAEPPPSWEDFLESPLEDIGAEEDKDIAPEEMGETGVKFGSSLPWQSLGQRAGAWAAISLLSTGAVMGLRWFGVLQPLELSAYDHLMQQRKAEPIDPRLAIVEVTQEDANQYGYPLDDDILVRAIDAIEQGEPAAIGLDMHRNQGRGQGREDLMAQFQQNPNLFLVCSSKNNKNYEPPPEFSAAQLKQQVGFSDLLVDRKFGSQKKAVRRQLLAYNPKLAKGFYTCITPYSFSVQLAGRFLEKQKVQIAVTDKGQWQFGEAIFNRLSSRTGGYQQLDGRRNQVLLNYRANPKPARRINLESLLMGQLDPNEIRGKIVLIGHTSDTARDDFQTPLGEMQGVWVHAHQVSHILSAAIDKRSLLWVLPQSGYFQWGDWLWVWFWALTGSGLLAIRWRSPLHLTLAAGAATFILYQACLIFLAFGGWIPLVPAVMSLFLAGGASALSRRYEDRTKPTKPGLTQRLSI